MCVCVCDFIGSECVLCVVILVITLDAKKLFSVYEGKLKLPVQIADRFIFITLGATVRKWDASMIISLCVCVCARVCVCMLL